MLWSGQTVSEVGSQITVLTLPLVALPALDATTFEVGLLPAAVTVAEHVECGQKGIEICLHKLTSVPFAASCHVPRLPTALTSDSFI
jgi:hypothetical protein